MLPREIIATILQRSHPPHPYGWWCGHINRYSQDENFGGPCENPPTYRDPAEILRVANCIVGYYESTNRLLGFLKRCISRVSMKFGNSSITVSGSILETLKSLRSVSKYYRSVIPVALLIPISNFRASHLSFLIRCNTNLAAADLITEVADWYWCVHLRGTKTEVYYYNGVRMVVRIKDHSRRPVPPTQIYSPAYCHTKYYLRAFQYNIDRHWKYGDYRRNNRTNYPSRFSTYRRESFCFGKKKYYFCTLPTNDMKVDNSIEQLFPLDIIPPFTK
jgi:hypothetical protein